MIKMTYIKPLSSNNAFGLFIPKNFYYSIILPNFETVGFHCGHYKNSILISSKNLNDLEDKIKLLSKKIDFYDSINITKKNKDLFIVPNNNILLYFNNMISNKYNIYKLDEEYYFEKWRYNWIKPELKIEYLNKKIN
jgi:hypothetical protein